MKVKLNEITSELPGTQTSYVPFCYNGLLKGNIKIHGYGNANQNH